MSSNLNSNLHQAKRVKNDEFYTRLVDIENELKHYRHHFKDKVVYCNCDDPFISGFFEYFSKNFERLGLKKLITTCYKSDDVNIFSTHGSERAIKLVYEGGAKRSLPSVEDIGITHLKGDGDFRSEECIEILKEADIVVTNPPFSLFREYVKQLMEHKKKFLIIGSKNAITYKEIFPLFRSNEIWAGYRNWSGGMWFISNNAENVDKVVDGLNLKNVPAIWLTNLDHDKRHKPLDLFKSYSTEEFSKYDNYDAIEVSRVVNIPENYQGVMGVPITFLDKYCPEQFKIIGMSASAGYDKDIVGLDFQGEKDARPLINGKNTYARIFIKVLK